MVNNVYDYLQKSFKIYNNTISSEDLKKDTIPFRLGILFLILIFFFFPILFFIRRKQNKSLKSIIVIQSKNQLNISNSYDLNTFVLNQQFKIKRLFNKNISLAALKTLNFILQNKNFKNYWWKIFRTIDCFCEFKDILNNNKLKRVLLLNDHTPHSLCIKYLSIDLNLEVAYLQHAPVSENFPALNWDFSFLFSEDSKNLYSIKHKLDLNKISIGGDPRFFYQNLPKKSYLRDVLICLSNIDNITKALDLANSLQVQGLKVSIRMHPLDRRTIPKIYRLQESKSFTDLCSSNYIIIGAPSAILLEALYAKVKIISASKYLSKIQLSEKETYSVYDKIKCDLDSKELILNSIEKNENIVKIDGLEYYIGTKKGFETQKTQINSWLKC